MHEDDKHFLSASHRKCILLSGTECHIINYLLTELAGAVPGNIGPWSFSYGQFKEGNAELKCAAVSGEEHCMTTLITAAKETINPSDKEEVTGSH